MVLLFVVLEALPGHVEALRTILHATASASQEEPGCVLYRFGIDPDAADRLLLTELWQEEAHLQAHYEGPAFLAFRAALPECGRVVESRRWAGALEPVARETKA